MEARRTGADDALLLNTAGELACCSAANFHLIDDEGIMTPPLECGVLAGITRELVRGLCAGSGLSWRERRLHPGDISMAKEAFITNSLIGVMPVTSIDGRPVGNGEVGEICIHLRSRHEALARAE
jgi:branched-subunit amino acid aminotransferase/4-amino-4-deoxychorismate lyase